MGSCSCSREKTLTVVIPDEPEPRPQTPLQTQPQSQSQQTIILDIWPYSSKKLEIRFNFRPVPESRYNEVWQKLRDYCEKRKVELATITDRLQAIAIMTDDQYSSISTALYADKTLFVRSNDHT